MAWRLADGLRGYFMLGRHPAHWPGIAAAGLAAAHRCGDPLALAAAELNVGQELASRWQHGATVDHLSAARLACEAAGWRAGESSALNALAQSHWQRGDFDEAIGYLGEAIALNRRLGRRVSEAIAYSPARSTHTCACRAQVAVVCSTR
jgi:tetratricopeptide (TPR) repeat protein